jgi:hypothetical protein
MPGASVRGVLVLKVGQVTGHPGCAREQLVRCMNLAFAKVTTEPVKRCYLAGFAPYLGKSAQQKAGRPGIVYSNIQGRAYKPLCHSRKPSTAVQSNKVYAAYELFAFCLHRLAAFKRCSSGCRVGDASFSTY